MSQKTVVVNTTPFNYTTGAILDVQVNATIIFPVLSKQTQVTLLIQVGVTELYLSAGTVYDPLGQVVVTPASYNLVNLVSADPDPKKLLLGGFQSSIFISLQEIASTADVTAVTVTTDTLISSGLDVVDSLGNNVPMSVSGLNIVNNATGNSASIVTSVTADKEFALPNIAEASANILVSEGTQIVNGNKEFVQPITISASTEQLILGDASVGNTTTITAPAPASGNRVYTIPDVGEDASFVMSSGGGGSILDNLLLTDLSNQLRFQPGVLGNLININVNSTSATRTHTIPDIPDGDFLFTTGSQEVSGEKEFSTSPLFSASTEQLRLQNAGAGGIVSVALAVIAADRTYTIPDVLANTSFTMLAGAQTFTGIKTFGAATTQLALQNGGVGNTISLAMTAPAANRIYTLPDSGADASFVMTAGTQSIAGAKTFSAAPILTATGTLLTFRNGGAGNTTSISMTTPGGARVYNLPDAGANAAFVLTAGNQSIGGAKTFTSNVSFNGPTPQVTFQNNGAGATIAIGMTVPAGNRTYTLPDVMTNTSFAMLAGTQTFNGAKTFSTTPTFSANTTQMILQNNGAGNTISLAMTAPAANRTYTFPDVETNTSFMMLGGTQDVNGTKRFLGRNLTCYKGTSTQFASLEYFLADGNDTISVRDRNGGTSNSILSAGKLWSEASSNQIRITPGEFYYDLTASAPAANRIYTLPDAGADTSFAMLAGTQTFSGSKSFSATASFIAATTQMILQNNGVGNTISLAMTAPAANRTYTLPDAGANTDFIMSAGTQNVIGVKTFTNSLRVGSAVDPIVVNSIFSGTSLALNIEAPNGDPRRINVRSVRMEGTTWNNDSNSFIELRNNTLSTSLYLTATDFAVNSTYNIPDVGTAADFIMSAGAQTVGGAKSFSSTARFVANTTQIEFQNNGTGNTISLAMTAPAANRTYTIPDTGANGNIAIQRDNVTVADLGFNGNFLSVPGVFRKIGDMIFVTLGGNITGNNVTEINSAGGIIPIDFRPSNFINQPVTMYSGAISTVLCNLTIGTTGDISIRTYDLVTTFDRFNDHLIIVSYPLTFP